MPGHRDLVRLAKWGSRQSPVLGGLGITQDHRPFCFSLLLASSLPFSPSSSVPGTSGQLQQLGTFTEEVGKLAVPVSSRQQVGPHPAGRKKGKTRLYLGPLLSLNILSFSGCSLGGGRALQKGKAEAQRWEVPSPLSPRESQVGSNPGILLPRS